MVSRGFSRGHNPGLNGWRRCGRALAADDLLHTAACLSTCKCSPNGVAIFFGSDSVLMPPAPSPAEFVADTGIAGEGTGGACQKRLPRPRRLGGFQ